MKELVLQENGTIKNGDDYIKFSDLERLFHSKPFGVLDATYDEENYRFIISILDNAGENTYILGFSPEREALLRNGIADQYIQILIKLAEEKKQEKKMREIDSKYIKTDELPEDYNELVEYNDYLRQQYNDTQTDVVKGTIYATSPLILAMVAGVAGKYGFSNLNTTLPFVVGGTISLSSAVFSLMSFIEVLTGESHPSKESILVRLGRLKADSRAYKRRIDIVGEKIANFNSSSEVKEKENFNNYPIHIDKKDNSIQTKEAKKIEEYRKEFLSEVMSVKNLIVKLPLEERVKYIEMLDALLNEYIQYCENLMVEEDLVNNLLEGASKFFADLNTKKLKELKELEMNVRRELIKIESRKDFEQVRSSLDAISSEAIYSGYGCKK